jgi:hypothetical protein
MNTVVVGALRVVIALALLGSLAVQGLMVPLIWTDLDGARTSVRVPFVVLVVLGVLALQVVGVCVWRLLTMVRRGTVFSFGAFRYVDVVIGALATGAVVVLGFAVLAAYSNRTTPGDEVAPGLVGLVCGLALVVAGVALLVYVMRTLLAQAVALDDETKQLQAELSEVI